MIEASRFLKLPYQRVRSWSHDGGLIANDHPGLLTFNNLLELHVLNGLRKEHELTLRRIRMALEHYRTEYDNPHPLLDPRIETDGFSLFLRDGEDVVNLNRAGQLAIPKIVSTYLRRIERHNDDVRFFPFVVRDVEDEPKSVQITPSIAFGKPVLAGTGITTEVIAGRFLNRDSIADLAEEYGVDESKIEDALRWELPHLLNAA
ncbi:MAG: DUF433 domain-containing protein [Acidobacteriaceae bacterium]